MTGALLQPMVPTGGVETIVGGMQDPSFGPLVVFGLGGIKVEVLGDHVTRLAPLTAADAREMVTGLRGWPFSRATGVRLPSMWTALPRSCTG